MKCFDAVYVMYLPEVKDRYENICSQVERVGYSRLGVKFFPGLKFLAADGFPSAGTKGCVLTFRSIFNHALSSGYQRILVLQDDCVFSKEFIARQTEVVVELEKTNWDIVYLGHGSSQKADAKHFHLVQADETVMLTHCCGYSARAMHEISNLIDASLDRPAGDPHGGPMYFDGYVNTTRAVQPELATFIANPSMAWQLSSASHLTPGALDGYLMLRLPLQVYRKTVNYIFSRFR